MKNFIFFSRIKVTTKTFHSCCFCLKKIQSGESNNTLLERCNISHFVNDPLYHCRANSFHLDIFAILGVQVFPEADPESDPTTHRVGGGVMMQEKRT